MHGNWNFAFVEQRGCEKNIQQKQLKKDEGRDHTHGMRIIGVWITGNTQTMHANRNLIMEDIRWGPRTCAHKHIACI